MSILSAVRAKECLTFLNTHTIEETESQLPTGDTLVERVSDLATRALDLRGSERLDWEQLPAITKIYQIPGLSEALRTRIFQVGLRLVLDRGEYWHRSHMLQERRVYTPEEPLLREQRAADIAATIDLPELHDAIALVLETVSSQINSEQFLLELIAFFKGITPRTACKDIAVQALRLTQGLDLNQKQLNTVLNTIKDLPSAEREDIVTQALRPIMISEKHRSANFSYRMHILELFKSLPSTGREDLATQAVRLSEGLPDGETQCLFIIEALRLMGGVPDPHFLDLEETMTIREMPRREGDQPAAMATAALPLMAGILKMRSRMDILGVIMRLPMDQRTAFASQASRLIETITEEKQRVHIIKFLAKIPQDEREAFTAQALHLLEGITSGKLRSDVLKALQLVPAAQREEFTAQSLTLTAESRSDFSRGRVYKIMAKLILGQVPADMRRTIITEILSSMNAIADEEIRGDLFRLIDRLPVIQLGSEENRRILRVFMERQDITHGLQKAINLKLQLIPSDRKMAALGILADHGDALSEGDILRVIFDADVSLCEDTRAFWQQELHKEEDRMEAYTIAQLILDHQAEFMLYEEHPLFQTIITVLANVNVEGAQNDVKNPYRLYRRLKEVDAAPLEVSYPTEGVERVALQVVERVALQVSVQPLMQKAEQIKRTMTFAELHRLYPQINADTLRVLFQSLQDHLDRLTPSAKDLVLGQIERQYGASYTTLQNEMSQDVYLNMLLRVRGSPEERVPLHIMRLYAVLQFVRDRPETREEGKLLNPREETLVAVASSIRGCPGGKQEGISLTYSWIKGQSRSVVSSDKEQIDDCVYSAVYSLLDSLFSDASHLMKEITRVGEGDVEQLSHQSIHLKNLIGKRVGLVWDLTFDLNTHMLYDGLVALTPEEALRAFFFHFLPSELIKHVKTRIDTDVCAEDPQDPTVKEKASALYNLLFQELDEDPEYWDVDGSDELGLEEGFSLKTAGVIRLLTSRGYLQAAEEIPSEG